MDDCGFDRRMIRNALQSLDSDLEFCELDQTNYVEATIEKESPQIVILDIMMPGKSGLDVLKDLTKDNSRKMGKILMMTGSASETDKVTAFERGASGFYTKPHSQANYKQVAKEIINTFL